MEQSNLRALTAATIYAGMHHRANALESNERAMRDAIDEADRLLAILGERSEDPESDVPPPVAPIDPYFVIHAETSKAISTVGTDRPCRPASWFDQQQLAIEESLEEIDAAMFSGDSFIDVDGIAYLEWYISRWVRTLSERRTRLRAQPEVIERPPPAPASASGDRCAFCEQKGHDAAHCPEIPF